jgi:hypothetical protein
MACRVPQNERSDGCNQGVEALAMAQVAGAAADESGFGVLDRDAPVRGLCAHVARQGEAIAVASDVEPNDHGAVLRARIFDFGLFNGVAQVFVHGSRQRLLVAETRRIETERVVHSLTAHCYIHVFSPIQPYCQRYAAAASANAPFTNASARTKNGVSNRAANDDATDAAPNTGMASERA